MPFRKGRLELARDSLGAGLAQLAKVENIWALTTELTAAVGLEVALGHPETALKLVGFIESSCREFDMKLPRMAALELEEGRCRALEQVDPAAVERLLEEGRGMELGEVAGVVGVSGPFEGSQPSEYWRRT